MAVIYLSSVDGNNSDDGSTWALAKATLAAALTAAGAGGTVYVDNAHAETQASQMFLASPGTAANPVTVLCASRASGAPPTALATTGSVAVTAGGIVFSGFTYVYGLTFDHGANGPLLFDDTSNVPWWWKFDNCSIKITGGGSGAFFQVGADSAGADDQLLELIDSNISTSQANQSLKCQSRIVWKGGAWQDTIPTVLFAPTDGPGGFVNVNGVDLSAAGSGKTIVGTAGTGRYIFENCKLGASVTLATAPAGQGSPEVAFINCDSADTNYNYRRYAYQGTIDDEATIVRTGGASDGTTPISRKMVTTANSKFISPLVSDPILFWNESTGSSVTATVEVVTDGVTLTDAEAWIEVEYLGTSGFPKSLFTHDRAANILATPANQTSSSVTWTTTGLSSPVKQKLSVSFTPQEKGLVQVRVHLAKASTTMYYCPKAEIS